MVTIHCPHCEELVEIELGDIEGADTECPECGELIEGVEELAELEAEEGTEADDDVIDLDLALDRELDGHVGRDRD